MQLWFEFHCAGDEGAMFTNLGAVTIGGGVLEGGDLTDLFDDCQSQFTAVLSSDYTCGPGYYLLGQTDDPLRFEGTTSALGSQGTPCPPNTSVLAAKQSTLSGRRGRGRCFVPGVEESAVDAAGFLDSTTQADFLTIFINIADRINAATLVGGVGAFVPALIHGLLRDPDTGDPIPGTALPPTPLVTLTIEPRVATQRRRLRH